ncbi:hypothetical protein V8E54_012734 [Elaphomyces granulatus]
MSRTRDFVKNAPIGDKRPRLLFRRPEALAAFSTADHDLHRIERRRAAQNPYYFSKRQILNFSPYIQSRVDKLVRQRV